MNLQDVIQADVSAVFLNTDEFAETHTIDGRQVVCVIDTDTDSPYSGPIGEGVVLVSRTVYARESDLAKPPAQGRMMMIDSKPYTVLSVSREMEMLAIVVTENDPT